MADGAYAKLAGPIANARHVPTRTRRRQGSPLLLRTALVLALVITLACGAFRLMDRTDASAALARNLNQPSDLSPVASQVLVPGLEAGACVSLAPTRAGSGQTVFIDPGHAGMDPGVVGGTSGRRVLEKDATLAGAPRLSTLLREDGYRVVMSRTQDSAGLKLTPADSGVGSPPPPAEAPSPPTRGGVANSAWTVPP